MWYYGCDWCADWLGGEAYIVGGRAYCSQCCADQAAAEADAHNPWPAGDLAMCDELDVMDLGMGGVEE
jgi:hypothetical protein